MVSSGPFRATEHVTGRAELRPDSPFQICLMDLFTPFIISLFLTIALVPLSTRFAPILGLLDRPGGRRVHTTPMPKTGGLAMALGALLPVMLWVPGSPFVRSVLAGAGIIVCFGLKDDIRAMGPLQKLIPQIAAALIVILWGHVRITGLGDLLPGPDPMPGMVSIPLTLVVILGITNAVNLADGLDGLAGGISVLSFIMIAFLAHQSENRAVALMALSMVGGIFGFLRYNTHPASLFMGDAGSQLLGFLAIVFAIALTQCNTPYSRVLSLPLIGFPVLDTLMVMVRRMRTGVSPFKPDKRHFHHRLLGLGFRHGESVLVIYIIQALYVAFALIFRFHSDWIHVSAWLALSSGIAWAVYTAEIRGWRRPGEIPDGRGQTRLWIKPAFMGLTYGFPLVFLAQIAIPAAIPPALALSSLIMALLCTGLFTVSFFSPAAGRLLELLLRIIVYMVCPLLIYLGEARPGPWVSPGIKTLADLSFIPLTLTIVMTMNLTRRTRGFRFTALDLLVCIVVLILPNLPSMPFQAGFARIALAKALIFFFSVDLILRESRGETKPLLLSLVFALSALAVRGAVSF